MATTQELRKIAFLTHGWTGITSALRYGEAPAGTASVFKLWERCRSSGMEVHVFIVAPNDGVGPTNFVALGGVHFHWVEHSSDRPIRALTKMNLRGLAYPLKFVDWVRLLAACRRYAPDADLYYSMRYGLGIPALLLARLNRRPVVVRYYGSWLYNQMTSGQIRQWLAALPQIATMKAPFDLMIMTNDGTRGDWVFSRLGVPESKTRFWVNGIRPDMNLPEFDQGAGKVEMGHGLEPGDFVMLCVGRLTAWKRQDILIRAMPRLIEENPRVKLVFVGTGEQEAEYQSLAQDLGVEDSVIFYGRVANEELPRYLNSCDVYFQVNDSSNVSTTLIEALSAGCCCVVRNEGAMDAIVDETTVVLLQSDSEDELANAVLNLMREPERRRELKDRALADSRVRFQTWDERLDQEIAELRALVH